MADEVIDLDDIPANSSVAETLDVAQPEHRREPDQPQADTRTDEAKAADAESSPAKGENEQFDPLKVVRDVVDKSRKDPQAASPPAGEEKPETGAQKQPDNENFTDVPFHKHPRFQHVVRKMRSYEADATHYRNVQSYLDQNQLTAQEAADGLMIMGLAKTDPVKCWELLQPFAQKVVYAAGAAITPDLQAEVDKGVMSQEVAARIASERARASVAQGQVESSRQRTETERQQAFRDSLSGAADSWEADRARKDPNFAAKSEAIQKEVVWLLRTEGRPTTPEGVKAQLEKAYKAVNASLPQPIRQNGARPVTPIRGGQVSGSTRAEPKNTAERIHMILDDTRRAASA